MPNQRAGSTRLPPHLVPKSCDPAYGSGVRLSHTLTAEECHLRSRTSTTSGQVPVAFPRTPPDWCGSALFGCRCWRLHQSEWMGHPPSQSRVSRKHPVAPRRLSHCRQLSSR